MSRITLPVNHFGKLNFQTGVAISINVRIKQGATEGLLRQPTLTASEDRKIYEEVKRDR